MTGVILKEDNRKSIKSRKVTSRGKGAVRNVNVGADTIISFIVDGLDKKIVDRIYRRINDLCSKLEYELSVGKNDNIRYIFSSGWDADMLKVVFALNAFFIYVVLPLHLASPPDKLNILKGIPIRYGNMTFDDKRRDSIGKMYDKFISICERIPGGASTVAANNVWDISRCMAKYMGKV